jgi:D-ribose pyranose/furanose isomerase RbsD
MLLTLFLACFGLQGVAQNSKPEWKARVAQALPLLGHRNWILIVDSAYPLQTSQGVETVDTNADQITVTQSVLEAINNSKHVRPLFYMDAELPFVPDEDAPGASVYREQIGKLLKGYEIQSQTHEKILQTIDETSKAFHVLVLKTNMTIPYTSVFIRLDCKYWSADEEKRMRARMSAVNVQK